MGDFSEFISDHALIDFPLEGGTFTWLNNHTPSSMSHLDRFLVMGQPFPWFESEATSKGCVRSHSCIAGQ